MRWLKTIGTVLLIIVGLVGILASLGKYYFENEVKQYVKQELNERLIAPVDVHSIDFSLIQKFPNASLSFEDVIAWDAFPEKTSEDTLFFAQKIFLEFNIIDLFQGNYVLSAISVDDADVRLKWNGKGENNYVIWKKPETQEEKEVKLTLKEVTFRNSILSIDHRKNEFLTNYRIDDLKLKGELDKELLNLNCMGSFSHLAYLAPGFKFISDELIDLNTAFHLDLKNEKIELDDAYVKWNDVSSSAKGSIDYGADLYSFSFSSSDQKAKDILRVLPDDWKGELKDYELDANIDFTIETGNSNLADWNTTINFNGKSGSITHIPSGISSTELLIEGNLIYNKKQASINLTSFSGNFSGGVYNGDFSMNNFQHPTIRTSLKGDFEIADLIHFFKNEDIQEAMGSLHVDMQFLGSFYDLKQIQRSEIEKAITSGSLELENASINLPRINLELRDVSGVFNLNDNDAAVPRLTGKWMGSNMELNGIITNFMPFILLENQKLYVRAEGYFDKIDLEKFLRSSGDVEKKESFQIPRYLSMDIEAEIGEITYQRFLASDAFGHFILQNGQLHSDDFGFDNAGGNVHGYLDLLSSSNGDLNLDIHSRLKNISISQLFYQFENLGQKLITDQHISGLLTADVKFNGKWNKELKLDSKSIEVLANVGIDNGQLKNVKSLEQIGEYLESNAMASAFIDTKGLTEKLKDINFDRLENQIEIRNEIIKIPEMQLTSDAVDINLSGSHDFDNNIDYAINFRLREIMKQRTETEFGVIEDDGLGSRIFLKMEGKASNPIISLDKEAKKDWKKDNWQSEKENISQILNDEFKGMFGGEKAEKPKEKAKKYEIEWDDGVDSSLVKTKTDTTKKKGKTLIFQTDDSDVLDSDDDDY